MLRAFLSGIFSARLNRWRMRSANFAGSEEGNFFALDARSGKPLWEIQTGGAIAANPVGFAIDGKQHVAAAAGQAPLVFGLGAAE